MKKILAAGLAAMFLFAGSAEAAEQAAAVLEAGAAVAGAAADSGSLELTRRAAVSVPAADAAGWLPAGVKRVAPETRPLPALERAIAEHYGIPADHQHRQHKLDVQYKSNITVRRTDFLGVEIGVLDQDAQWAADIANYIAAMYDTLCHDIHSDRAESAAEVMVEVCTAMEREIDSLSQLPATPWRSKLIADKCEQLADLQTRSTQTTVDKGLTVSYKYSVDTATPADKKAYPKRLLIMLGGMLGAVVVCIFALLLFVKKED